ncbi:MAG: helix-hairpin-helix domain-containing protein [Woeseiaceae bacterium]|nr:helix-hairpin-helix domain-containing protein [Woeseiaceae bacterium]
MIIRTFLVLAIAFASSQALAQAGAGLDDANLVSAETLAGHALLDEQLADTIVRARPFLTAADLDSALSNALNEEDRQALYASVFRQINLNTAAREEIMLIPGMSARMAHEFEEYRPYTSLEQFRREIGKYVDDDEVARLEQYVFVPLGLNSASEDDLMTIPGMTPKMVHEFEEYRPYASMEQFRREIGKYVDDDEVARLESYVTLD